MRRLRTILIWSFVSAAGTASFAWLALSRGEPVNAAWLLVAALCTYAVSYRFYSKFIASRIFALDPARPTPAVRLNDGRDYMPTNRWIVFGHHFAAIAGPGPLVGPTLAAQFGFLPGAIWIIVGVALGGAVQDFVILCASVRRDGKSLGQMAKEEIGPIAGFTALVAVFGIMIILIAVLALVVVNALKASPWGVVTIGLTIPTALIMGVYMRWIRPHRVLEASAIGLVLLLVALFAGRWVASNPALAPAFTLTGKTLALLIMAYSFFASVLPVWLLLAPRDYLSAFVKIGVVLALALGIVIVLPPLQMPALTQFTDGTGPVFAGKVFPFAFITIACGAISGFHSLIASGTTPKLLTNEADARPVGYGAMLTESLVAVMALIAACVLTPGVYFAINAPASAIGTTAASAAAAVQHWGFTLDPAQMQILAQDVGEKSLLSRTGGAPSLAVGMAHIFSRVLGGSTAMALWYHFAIMFEALFILTTVDAGTRVGRFMLQDLLKHVWAPIGRVSWYPSGGDGQRPRGLDVGLLPLPGSDGPAWRHQLALAAVRNLQPAACRGSIVRRHYRDHQDGKGALCVGDDSSARLARDRDVDGRLAEDLFRRSQARLPFARTNASGDARDRGAAERRSDAGRCEAPDPQRPHRCGGRGVLSHLCRRDSRRVGARMVQCTVGTKGRD